MNHHQWRGDILNIHLYQVRFAPHKLGTIAPHFAEWILNSVSLIMENPRESKKKKRLKPDCLSLYNKLE